MSLCQTVFWTALHIRSKSSQLAPPTLTIACLMRYPGYGYDVNPTNVSNLVLVRITKRKRLLTCLVLFVIARSVFELLTLRQMLKVR